MRKQACSPRTTVENSRVSAIHDELFISVTGLLRLQQIYQDLKPGNESFQVETVKRIQNMSEAIDFLRSLEELNR